MKQDTLAQGGTHGERDGTIVRIVRIVRIEGRIRHKGSDAEPGLSSGCR